MNKNIAIRILKSASTKLTDDNPYVCNRIENYTYRKELSSKTEIVYENTIKNLTRWIEVQLEDIYTFSTYAASVHRQTISRTPNAIILRREWIKLMIASLESKNWSINDRTPIIKVFKAN